MDSAEDMVVLNAFFDAFEADRACQLLEESGIPFEVRDFSVRQHDADHFSEGPSVGLDVLVTAKDLDQAKACLREKMGLFPEREIDEHDGDYPVDGDGKPSQAIICDTPEDAQAAQEALSDAGIQSTINRAVDEEDGTVSYSVDVQGKDVERAVSVMDRWTESR